MIEDLMGELRTMAEDHGDELCQEALSYIDKLEKERDYLKQQYVRKCEHEFEVRKHDSQLKKAIIDWCETIVTYEGIDFADKIEDESSRKLIESILDEHFEGKNGN
jgi:hypothetical protein